MRKVAVVTTSRADYGILFPLLKAVEADPRLGLQLVVGGSHLLPEHRTVEEIERDGMTISASVDCLVDGDDGANVPASIAKGIGAFADALGSLEPDIVVVLGDRFEMFAGAVAASSSGRPVAHLQGGELTLGALDDLFRHAITKLSHLHFVAHDDYARRVVQMGEERWRVVVSGALALDNLRTIEVLDWSAVAERLGVPDDPRPLLLTFHPATLEDENPVAQVQEVLRALEGMDVPVIVTAPNVDPGGDLIRVELERWVAGGSNRYFFVNLGRVLYLNLMRYAGVMVGNSSSGLLEAASFGLPVVNVGGRQDGRIRPTNVLDVPVEAARIAEAVSRASTDEFKGTLSPPHNPFDRGGAAQQIVTRLAEVELGSEMLRKSFADQDAAT